MLMHFLKLNDIFTFICTLQKITEISGFNLAYNKDSYVCNKMLEKGITDGDIHTNIELDEMFCKDYDLPFVHIYLEELYNVQFVMVGSAKTWYNFHNFVVELKEGDYILRCAEYPTTLKLSKMFRVNCKPSTKVFSEVIVISSHKQHLNTPEIEVHSLGESMNGHSLIYRGCFSNFNFDPIPINWEKCQLKCLKNNFLLAGIKDNKYCGCQDNVRISDFALITDCDIKCDDGLRYCGGKNFFSVYLVTIPLPYYKGCYDKLDESDIAKKKTHNSMTVVKCLRFCDKYDHAVIQEQKQCLCVDQKMFGDKLPASNCDKPCPEDDAERCGGESHASVWGTCRSVKPNSITCSELFNCDLYQRYDKFGVCEGICKPNFKGEYCMDRIVNITITRRRKKYGQHVRVEASFLSELLLTVQMYSPFILPWCSVAIFGGMLWWSIPFRTSEELSGVTNQEDVLSTLNILMSPSSNIGTKDAKNVKDTKAVSKTKEKKYAEETKHGKVTKDAKETKKSKDAKHAKDTKDAKETKHAKEAKLDKGTKDGKEKIDAKETKHAKEAKLDKGTKDGKETKDAEETKDTKEVKVAKETKDAKDVKETADATE